MSDKDLLDYWEATGYELGYSPCCIEAFLKQEQVHTSVFSGTGFLPCKACNKLKPSEVTKDINRRRLVKSNFPDEYLEGYNDKTLKSLKEHANNLIDGVYDNE